MTDTWTVQIGRDEAPNHQCPFRHFEDHKTRYGCYFPETVGEHCQEAVCPLGREDESPDDLVVFRVYRKARYPVSADTIHLPILAVDLEEETKGPRTIHIIDKECEAGSGVYTARCGKPLQTPVATFLGYHYNSDNVNDVPEIVCPLCDGVDILKIHSTPRDALVRLVLTNVVGRRKSLQAIRKMHPDFYQIKVEPIRSILVGDEYWDML